MLKIYIASDHAGVERKSELLQELRSNSFLPTLQREIHDLGPQSSDSVDYPDFADQVCKKIHSFSIVQNQSEKSFPTSVGILICGSGQGMAMRANKYPHIRAALCWSIEVARLAREHNDANILCLGSRLFDLELSSQMTEAFLSTPFAGGRHAGRVAKVSSPI